jgi:hypothetical protein
MDFEQLKSGITEIAAITATVPEQFRDKCFELLLAELLNEAKPNRDRKEQHKNDPKEDDANAAPAPKSASKMPLTTQIRLFMRKTGVTPEEIEKVVLYENDEVHFVKEPHNVPVSQGQIEWALMLALRNGILKDALTADPEDVRSICQEKGYYDTKNFAANFKRGVNANLFKSPLVPQGDAQSLAAEGQDALGKLIKRLASEVA